MSVMSSATPRRASLVSMLGAVGLLAGTAFAVAQSGQPAQQQPRPAQPRPAQQQPQQPAQAPAQPDSGPTVVQLKPEPSQTEWTKVCGKDQVQNKEICYTTRDFVSDQGQPVMAVAIYDVKGDSTRIARFLMPLGLFLQPGIRFNMDRAQPIPGRFQICFPNGCFAEAQIRDDVINAMKKGGNLTVRVQNQATREVAFTMPMTGFGKAFDGPPIDPKVLEDQQRQLQEELQKRSEEMRKRLEAAGGGAGAPAPAQPATPPATPPRP